MSQLALFGGIPVRAHGFPPAITTGEEELKAVVEVMKSGFLSGFVGSPGPEFLGGPRVKELEAAWCEKFKIAHAVSCNSATSALVMAIGACEIGPGDEVIVSPYTMSATATAVLFYGGVPVFADIEPQYFCLDAASIRRKITTRTKAILTTDIHGQPSSMDEILQIAREYKLRVIIDAAQSAGSKYQEDYAGTMGDVGVYSLNRHKNIQCGEGGVAVCNDPELALRLQLIRNHGENVTESAGFVPKSLVNILGFNFRMTELEAAIALQQLYKLDGMNSRRVEMAQFVHHKLTNISGLTMPAIRGGCTHIFYMQAILYDDVVVGVSRDLFIKALNAEGIPIRGGYVRPLYLEPLYQRQIAIGGNGYPFVGPHYSGKVDYSVGRCPIAEQLFERRTLINPFLYPPLETSDMQDIVDGIKKVMDNRMELIRYEEENVGNHTGARRI